MAPCEDDPPADRPPASWPGLGESDVSDLLCVVERSSTARAVRAGRRRPRAATASSPRSVRTSPPRASRSIDASGALVTPGLIDPHTHYDLEMFWDPTLDPLPSYGMTTIVMGNCGLGIAPVRDDVRDDIADLLCFIEELPFSLSTKCVPWGWSTWSEYHAVAAQTPTTVTPFAYTAHNALAGLRDGSRRVGARRDRRRARLMVMLLEDALAHGSLGMSTNWFDTDRNRELVPSRLSDDAELDALIDVLARHPHATLQVIARGAADRRRVLEKSLARAACACCRSVTAWAASPTPTCPVSRLGGGAEPFSPRLGIREHDRGRRGAGVARDDQRPRRRQAPAACRRRLARPRPPRLGQPARRAERVPQGAAARSDPLRLGERHRAGGHLAEGPRRAARRPPVGRAGRLGARERHRLALHEALGAAAGHPAGDGRPGQGGLRRPVRAHRRYRRRRAPQHVLWRGRERLRAHALGARRGRDQHRAGRPLHDAAQRRRSSRSTTAA